MRGSTEYGEGDISFEATWAHLVDLWLDGIKTHHVRAVTLEAQEEARGYAAKHNLDVHYMAKVLMAKRVIEAANGGKIQHDLGEIGVVALKKIMK